MILEHRAMHALVKRGDIDSMSFAFVQKDQDCDGCEEGFDNGEMCAIRTLKDVDLREDLRSRIPHTKQHR